MKHRFFAVALIAASSLAARGPALAQVERSGGESQRFMQQYQQLAAEKTALQAQMEKMKKDLDAANADLASMKKERDALKAHPAGAPPAVVAQLTASKESAERSVGEYKQRMSELVARFRETATNLRDTEADRNKLRGELDLRNAAFDKCAENNQQLYEINGEILNRYDHVGLFTKARASEPFTQITRTRMDNLVVETRTRAEELRVKKRSPSP
jgi:chromosome segregation ATPase